MSVIDVVVRTGESFKDMEVLNYKDMYKGYEDITDDISKIIGKDAIVVYGNECTNFVGDGCSIDSVSLNPIIIVGRKAIIEEELMILLHEAVHGVQSRTGKLRIWSEGYTEWNHQEYKRKVFFGQKDLLEKDNAVAYLNFPWEREAWMITAAIGSRILKRVRSKYNDNREVIDNSGLRNFIGMGIKEGLTKLYGYNSVGEFVDEAEGIYEEYLRA